MNPCPPPLSVTTRLPFAACDGQHPPLFTVTAGVDLNTVLVHLSRSLEAAIETNLQACEVADRRTERLTWATQHSLEIAQALVGSLVGGGEKR